MVDLRLCIHISRPFHGYSIEGAYHARSRPSLCHSVVTCMCTVVRVEENVYKLCGLTESLVYSLEIFQRMHSRAMPCHAMAIALARHIYTLIHEPSEVTSRQPPPWPRGSNVTYIYIYIYKQLYIQTIIQTRADVMQD